LLLNKDTGRFRVERRGYASAHGKADSVETFVYWNGASLIRSPVQIDPPSLDLDDIEEI
jgi:hypothetical protein